MHLARARPARPRLHACRLLRLWSGPGRARCCGAGPRAPRAAAAARHAARSGVDRVGQRRRRRPREDRRADRRSSAPARRQGRGAPARRRLPHGGHAGKDRRDGARRMARHGDEEGPPDRAHGHRLPARNARRTSRSGSTATAPTGSASPTTSRASRSSCTRWRCCNKLGLQGLRHADRARQRRRGDQLARLAQHHQPRRVDAGRGVLVRGQRQRRRAFASRRAGSARRTHRRRPLVARRRATRRRHQRALRARAPDPAD